LSKKDQQRQGRLFVISAPSGAGKTSLVKALVESTPEISVSISHTTRAMRTGEQDGVNYHFVTVETFQELVKKSAFLEHAQVFDNYYGTSRDSVLEQLAQGDDLILEIDWQGARQVCDEIPGAVGIFILPPSREELERRLQSRGQDSDEIIARRMQDAKSEISHYKEFDYIVINDDFETALTELREITQAQGQQGEVQQRKVRQLLADLLA
jgi:guanylate kinase